MSRMSQTPMELLTIPSAITLSWDTARWTVCQASVWIRPRGKNFRVAVVLFTKADNEEGLHIHTLEYIESDQVKNAVLCMQKLRKLSKGIHTVSIEKRSHSVELVHEGMSPSTTKKARILQAVPSAASLPE